MIDYLNVEQNEENVYVRRKTHDLLLLDINIGRIGLEMNS